MKATWKPVLQFLLLMMLDSFMNCSLSQCHFLFKSQWKFRHCLEIHPHESLPGLYLLGLYHMGLLSCQALFFGLPQFVSSHGLSKNINGLSAIRNQKIRADTNLIVATVMSPQSCKVTAGTTCMPYHLIDVLHQPRKGRYLSFEFWSEFCRVLNFVVKNHQSDQNHIPTFHFLIF